MDRDGLINYLPKWETLGDIISKQNRDIIEEYKSWKMNTPYLYDLIIIKALEWPSLTVQWLPDREEPGGEDYAIQKLILGTQAYEDDPNYLYIAQVKLPLGEEELVEEVTFQGYHPSPKVQINQRIKHDGEVHRARYMPQNSNVIATKSVKPEVYLFDISKHPTEPDLKLMGHTTEGFGLSWSKFKHGHLLSGSFDGHICLWDINVTPRNKTLEAMNIFKIHEGEGVEGVQDVDWNLKNENIFGSVGADNCLNICDLRKPADSLPTLSVVGHENIVTSLAFNPYNEYLVATGSIDETVKLFDIRKFYKPVHTLTSHKDSVYQIGWNPKEETIIASSDHGRRLLVWDLSRIGEVQTPEKAEDGPPELLFIHGGHTSEISDFSWSPCEEWIIASVAEDNVLHIWQMADHIYNDEDDEHDAPEKAPEAS
ncbi:hypothetical protein UlMin_019308 [Ulmus minor]